MKVFLSILLTVVMVTPALAQGKIRLVNDSLHLVYFTTDTSYLLPGDQALAGQAYVLGEGQEALKIELWAGTSSTALSLVASTDFTGQGGPGTWLGVNVQMSSIPAGLAFFDIWVFDAALGSITNGIGGRHYIGTSGLFTAMASGVAAYYSLVQHNSPGSSTWADGTFDLDSVLPGYRGAIQLMAIPEPSTFALGCLGFAMLLLRRRAESNMDLK
jgi:hypothetical protein